MAALCCSIGMSLAATAQARVVTIRWSDPDPSQVTAYRLYARSGAQSYGAASYDGLPAAVGGVYSAQISVADTGASYVVATAYNAAGESVLSNELTIAPPACGDGRIDAGEQCDDGNTVSGDGCSATCKLEACGNGVLDAGEQCDDGNKVSGDGCSATCKLEVCGNGVLDAGEQCDDGNSVSGDGCDAQCRIETASLLPYRLDVGNAGTWKDPYTNELWSSDAQYAAGGVVVNRPNLTIVFSNQDPLYWTARVGDGTNPLHFALPVPGLGPYHVRLYFAEFKEVTAKGQRVFDVLLENGVVTIKNLDIFAQAGSSQYALVKDLYVLVDDGELDIDLVPGRGLPPMISAIEVLEGGTPPPAPNVKRCGKNGACP
jgi:cysteine-rich repeat protein